MCVCVYFFQSLTPIAPSPPPLQLLWVTNVLSDHVFALYGDLILFDNQISHCDQCVCAQYFKLTQCGFLGTTQI